MNLTVFCFEDITVVLSKNTSTTFNTTGASGFFLWLLGDFFLFVLFENAVFLSEVCPALPWFWQDCRIKATCATSQGA